MRRSKWIGLVIGTSLVGSGLSALPASAIPNQSDITGTNIWNGTAPVFGGETGLDPEIIDQARRLGRGLTEASERCENAAAPTGPRRIARGPRNPSEVCISPECEQLNSLARESRVFLDDVNRQVGQVRTNSGSQAW